MMQINQERGMRELFPDAIFQQQVNCIHHDRFLQLKQHLECMEMFAVSPRKYDQLLDECVEVYIKLHHYEKQLQRMKLAANMLGLMSALLGIYILLHQV